MRSSTGLAYGVDWGVAGEAVVPVPADYDADSKIDTAFYYPAARTFYGVRSTTGQALYIQMADISPSNGVPVLKRPE